MPTARRYSKPYNAKPYGKKADYKKKSPKKAYKTRPKRPVVKVAKVDAPKKIATSHWKSSGGELSGKSKPMKGEAIGTSIFTKTDKGRVKGTDGGAGQVASLLTAVYPRTDIMYIKGSLLTNSASNVSSSSSNNLLYNSCIALFKSATVEHFITNQTNGNVFVDLYEVVSKIDQGLSPEISTQQEITTPLEAFDNGLASAGLGNAFYDIAGTAYTYPGSTTMGVTPTMSQQFKKLWKILKKTTLCLGSGETVQHQSVHKPNYKFDYAKTRGELSGAETVEEAYVRGLTVFTMAIVHGQPCDLDADGTVGLTIPEINWTSNVVYRSTAFPMSKSTNANFTGGVTALASGKIFTQTVEATNQPT